MRKDSKIYVAGHKGMVGSAIFRRLQREGFQHLVVADSRQLDLRRQTEVEMFFERERPEYVFLAAAKVGGILANDRYRAEFLYDNLMIEANVIHAAYRYGVKKLLFLGSSCIYPKLAPQPLAETALLSGPLEPTNEPYAIAKIAGIKLCDAYRAQYACNFISAMPTNLYGPNDNYHPENSHVLPALVRKFHEARVKGASQVTLWGTGTPLREFLYVDDLADACLFLMERFDEPGPINVGVGKDISIRDLAVLVSRIVGYAGDVAWDETKPDGTPRKLMDTGRLASLGWVARTPLEDGIRMAYRDFLQNVADGA